MWGLAVTADQVLQKWWQEPWIQCMYRRKKDLDAWSLFESWPMSTAASRNSAATWAYSQPSNTIEVWLVGCRQPCLVCAWHSRAARRLSTWIYAHVDSRTTLGIYWIAVKRGLDQQFVEGAVDGKSQEVGWQERQWRSRLPDFGGNVWAGYADILCMLSLRPSSHRYHNRCNLAKGKEQRVAMAIETVTPIATLQWPYFVGRSIYSQWPRQRPDRGHGGSTLKPPAPLTISVYLALCAHRSGACGDHMLGWSYAFLATKRVWNGRLRSDAMRQKKNRCNLQAMCLSHGCEGS